MYLAKKSGARELACVCLCLMCVCMCVSVSHGCVCVCMCVSLTQNLEERGLIQRTPVMIHDVVKNNASCLTTNVLHLIRFAPPVRLGPYQVFKVSSTDTAACVRHCEMSASVQSASVQV